MAGSPTANERSIGPENVAGRPETTVRVSIPGSHGNSEKIPCPAPAETPNTKTLASKL